MDPSHNNTDPTEARAILSELSECYYSILKEAQIERNADNSVACTLNAPGVGKLTSTASSELEAIRLALIELASTLTTTLSIPSSGEFAVNRVADQFKSKARQLTIGVTMPVSLRERFCKLAELQETSFADITRSLAVYGFENFEDKSFFTNTHSLFSILTAELRQWQSTETQQVMLRLEPGHAVRIRAAAKEFKKSASEFSALCLAHGLALQEQLEVLGTKIEKYKGPAIRPLLSDIGLESYAAPLLSGILVGSVEAPRKILRRLATFFEASEEILTDYFRQSFRSKEIPAFKAESGKPVVEQTPTRWEDAVKTLKLSQNQTKDLIDLDG